MLAYQEQPAECHSVWQPLAANASGLPLLHWILSSACSYAAVLTSRLLPAAAIIAAVTVHACPGGSVLISNLLPHLQAPRCMSAC